MQYTKLKINIVKLNIKIVISIENGNTYFAKHLGIFVESQSD